MPSGVTMIHCKQWSLFQKIVLSCGQVKTGRLVDIVQQKAAEVTAEGASTWAQQRAPHSSAALQQGTSAAPQISERSTSRGRAASKGKPVAGGAQTAVSAANSPADESNRGPAIGHSQGQGSGQEDYALLQVQ